ncbi:alpha amylase, catalytic region [Flavobacteriales bacterium ALC-1]|nr:alpha amylase, catalytic region [Flavobacteriales bacterium ALC-1]
MKKIVLITCLLLAFIACKTEKKEVVEVEEEKVEVLKPISASDMETAVIYEANIRQYSPEGTFDEFTKDIPQLKELGVKVIWLMPVFPISETKRKATGGKFASEFPKEEQAKYLGSYYAVTDFTKINPEFGTKDDFRELVKEAHENGIYVILDWVPNHTGWDHEWLKTNPEYYTQNDKGEVIHPKDTDWTDVADLNYDNQDMRKEMIEDMMYWVTDEGIDGFRCDVAGSVPLDFWQQAVPQLRDKKDLFMLAEAWEPELLDGDLFDMAYGWDRHHRLNDMAKGKNAVQIWNEQMQKDNERYDADDILMNFVTNHDENSWNGTIKERMGDASKALTALSYVAPGMPLIYSGQEYDLDHRLKFFEKDSFPKIKGESWKLLEKLGQLKSSNAALNGGKNAATYKQLDSEKDILMFERSKGEDTIIFIGNISNTSKLIPIPEGYFEDGLSSIRIKYANKPIKLNSWEYKILIKQ